MTQRFGRNKRRQARRLVEEALQRMEAARDDAIKARRDLRHAEHRAAHAMEIALESVMKKEPNIQLAMRQLANSLGEQVGPKLLPIAQKILASDRSGQRQPSFTASVRYDPVKDRTVEVLRGEIHLDYNIALLP